jgi:hypothetical protein
MTIMRFELAGRQLSADTVEVEDTPSTRGMVNTVNYLIRVEE